MQTAGSSRPEFRELTGHESVPFAAADVAVIPPRDFTTLLPDLHPLQHSFQPIELPTSAARAAIDSHLLRAFTVASDLVYLCERGSHFPVSEARYRPPCCLSVHLLSYSV